MQQWIASPWLQDFASNLLVSLVVVAVGFVCPVSRPAVESVLAGC